MRSTHCIRPRDESGFTLIEILVVILIVGILTSIAVPSFLSQRTKGEDACAKSMAKQMYTATKTFQSDSGNYGGANLASLTEIENTVRANSCGASTGVRVSDPAAATPSGNCPASAGVSTANANVGFCVAAQSSGGTWLAITEKGGILYRTCEIPAGQTLPYGGCKGSGGTTGSW
jgi:type IV pilus assembly protein PilA